MSSPTRASPRVTRTQTNASPEKIDPLSPCTTQAQRDAYARRPLHTDKLSLPSRSTQNVKISPKFTSSPLDASASSFAGEKKRISPGLSRIESPFDPDREHRSDGEDPEVAGSESDDERPSAKVTFIQKQNRGTNTTPQRPKEKPRRKLADDSAKESSTKQHQFLGVLLVIVAVFLYVFLSENSIIEESFWPVKVQALKKGLSEIKQDFPSQEHKSWSIISSSLKSVLKDEPSQPSVLLLLASQRNRQEANCLAQRLLVLSHRLSNHSYDVTQLREAGTFKSQSSLFDAVHNDLSTSSSFGLLDIQHLSGAAAMALHAFCDNDSAPFKNSSIVITLTNADEADDVSAEEAAEKSLESAWSGDLDADRISPLISRIAVSVTRVVGESAQGYKSQCSVLS